MQLVSKDHEIKLQLHIVFNGEENLIPQRLQLQVQKPEIDVFGKMAIMPDALSVDVSQMALGDTITIKNFDLNKEIRVTDKEDEIYASITQMKEEIEEEVEEVVETAEAVTPETETKEQ